MPDKANHHGESTSGHPLRRAPTAQESRLHPLFGKRQMMKRCARTSSCGQGTRSFRAGRPGEGDRSTGKFTVECLVASDPHPLPIISATQRHRAIIERHSNRPVSTSSRSLSNAGRGRGSRIIRSHLASPSNSGINSDKLSASSCRSSAERERMAASISSTVLMPDKLPDIGTANKLRFPRRSRSTPDPLIIHHFQ